MEKTTNLELIKNFSRDILAENINNYEHIINMIDNGNISSSQFGQVQEFIKNCVADNDNIINNYYVYDYNFTPNAYETIKNLAYNSYIFKVLYSALYLKDIISNEDVQKYMYDTFKNSIKGIRDNTPIHKLIGEYLKINFCDNGEVSRFVEMFAPKQHKYILFVGNTPLAQLTSTYTTNYDSCYDLRDGAYRASNVYLMNDNKNHIVKIFDYNDNNLNMVENDTLKYNNNVISRFNLWIDKENKYLISAKNYGDTSYFSNSATNRKKLINELTNTLYNFTSEFIDCYEANIRYCNDFMGYKDYTCNFRFCSANMTEDVSVTIGKSNLITWDIYKKDMIIGGYKCCADCGGEYDESDLYYCEDTNDYRCYDCCWWCAHNECYYSNDTDYVETPSGDKYRYSDCYFNN